MIGKDTPLSELRAHFLATSTQSMPLIGLILWAALGVLAPFMPSQTVGWMALAGPGLIFPIAALLDKLRAIPKLTLQGAANPITQMFMQSIAFVALVIPFVIIASGLAKDVDLIVLGMALLSGLIWIPYGWGADDRVGLFHAIVRAVGCYAAYLLAPVPYRASAICAVVVVAYIYSLIAMKRPA